MFCNYFNTSVWEHTFFLGNLNYRIYDASSSHGGNWFSKEVFPSSSSR